MPIGATYAFPTLAHEWLKHELDFEFSRKALTLVSGAGNLVTGTVLGQVTKGAASSAAKAGGNTGGGSLTLDVTTPILAGAVPGVYSVRCVGVVANAGLFEVKDPRGTSLGNYAIGGPAFANQIKFAMADSGTDFALGDGFDITVAAGSGKWKKHINGAVDGTEIAAAILLNGADATSADVKTAAIFGKAVINPLALTWDASVDSQPKKDAALAQLALLGIDTRLVA